VAKDLEPGNAVAEIQPDRSDGGVVADAGTARQVGAIEAKIDALGRNIARVAENGSAQGAPERNAQLDGRFPERKATDRDAAFFPQRARVAGGVGGKAITVELERRQIRIQEGNVGVRTDAPQRIAAVGARTTRKESPEVHDLKIAGSLRLVL